MSSYLLVKRYLLLWDHEMLLRLLRKFLRKLDSNSWYRYSFWFSDLYLETTNFIFILYSHPLKCPQSICFYNNETLEEAYCVICDGNGQCNNGICTCTDGLFSDEECDTINCRNSCNSASQAGECRSYFPENQCRCN